MGRVGPGPGTSPVKAPTVRLDRDPSYRPYDNTAINTGLPAGLNPPLPQKPRPFRPSAFEECAGAWVPAFPRDPSHGAD